MKRLLFILTLGLIGCTSSNKETNQLDEGLVFDQASNWKVNLDSLGTIDNYILTYRELGRNGLEPIRPYITTSIDQRISLREIRQARGSGYFWDCRTHLRIFINPDGSFFSSWNSGQSCNSNDIIQNEKSFEKIEQLRSEILQFYSTNSQLKFSKELDANDLEIWITPTDDNLSSCKAVIEHSALAYQEFKNQRKNKSIPLHIVISPKQDQQRIDRIIKKEKNSTQQRL